MEQRTERAIVLPGLVQRQRAAQAFQLHPVGRRRGEVEQAQVAVGIDQCREAQRAGEVGRGVALAGGKAPGLGLAGDAPQEVGGDELEAGDAAAVGGEADECKQPLALLCTGATLDFRSLRAEAGNTLLAATGKLVAMPLVFTLGAWAVGFRSMELGVLMLMASAPSAAASYAMVRAMGGNATLAANIIALTTLGSLLTTSAGVSLLRGFGLI